MPPRDLRFGKQRCFEHLVARERTSDQRVDGGRARNGRCRAATLTSGKWKSLRDPQRDSAGGRGGAHVRRAPDDRQRGDRRRVTSGVGRQRFAWPGSSTVMPGARREFSDDGVACSFNGASEDIEPGTQVANGAGA